MEVAALADPADVLAGLEGHPCREDVPPDYLAFRIRLYQAQVEVYRSARAASSLPRALPVVVHELPMDEAGLLSILAAARAALVAAGGGAPLVHSIEAVQARPAVARELARAAAGATDAGELAVPAGASMDDAEAAFFLGRALAAPFVAAAVRRALERGACAPERATGCPCCTSRPGLSLIVGEEGKRWLACPLCAHTWQAPRAVCPLCADSTALGVLREAEGGARWIESCDSCRGCIRTLDTRAATGAAPFIPLVEAIGGMYLDFVAEKHGYLRGVPYVAVG
jgi:hypothetical protein